MRKLFNKNKYSAKTTCNFHLSACTIQYSQLSQNYGVIIMKQAFTLIELLIVVAIIAILAAIAVPNFLEAQTRAKVTRCKSDMRTIAVALESYFVDYNKFPFDGANSKITGYDYWNLPKDLTTPVAYSTIKDYSDPFRATNAGATLNRNLRYVNVDSTWAPADTGYATYSSGTGTSASTYYGAYSFALGKWRMTSSGPDRLLSNGSNTTYSPAVWTFTYNGTAQTLYEMNMPYDATNGTTSYGDIVRTQKNPEGYGK